MYKWSWMAGLLAAFGCAMLWINPRTVAHAADATHTTIAFPADAELKIGDSVEVNLDLTKCGARQAVTGRLLGWTEQSIDLFEDAVIARPNHVSMRRRATYRFPLVNVVSIIKQQEEAVPLPVHP